MRPCHKLRRVSARLRRRPLRGVSIVEFLVASSLVLAILVGSGVTLAAVERSLARDRARDTATAAAASILEQASLFSCQMIPDPADAETVSEVCSDLLTGTTRTDSSGDVSFTYLPPGCQPNSGGCTEFDVVLSSRWLDVDDPTACPSSVIGQPDVLERRLSIGWRSSRSTDPVTADYTALQAVPLTADYQRSTLRAATVVVSEGDKVIVSTAGGDDITRTAFECDSPTGPRYEVWLPFLDPIRAYSYRVVTADGVTRVSGTLRAVDLEGCNGILVATGASSSCRSRQ